MLGLVAAATAAAQSPEFERCAKLESDAERLACFDAAIREGSAVPNAPAPPEESTVAPASPAEKTRQEPATEKTMAEPLAPKVPPEPSAAPGPVYSSTSSDAAEPRRRQDEKPTAEREPRKEYTAVVVSMRKRPHGQMVVKLDNGEVWSEQYASRAFLVDVGDTITMKRSRFAPSYRLVAPGGRGYKMTRLE